MKSHSGRFHFFILCPTYLSALIGGSQAHQPATAKLMGSGSKAIAIGGTYCFAGAEAFESKHGKNPLTWLFKAARIATYLSFMAGV